jgi:hypothetical protein
LIFAISRPFASLSRHHAFATSHCHYAVTLFAAAIAIGLRHSRLVRHFDIFAAIFTPLLHFDAMPRRRRRHATSPFSADCLLLHYVCAAFDGVTMYPPCPPLLPPFDIAVFAGYAIILPLLIISFSSFFRYYIGCPPLSSR